MKRIFVRFALLVIAVSIGSGCAVMNKEVVLQPVNATDLSPRAPENKLPVYVVMPSDNRNLNPAFVGYVRNGFNVHTADVVADKEVDLWLREILLDNIRNAGYKATPSGKAAEGIAVYSVISRLDCDMKLNFVASYENNIELQVIIKKDNQNVFSKTFSNTITQPAAWGTESEYQSLINSAMQKTVNDMMPDILKALKRTCENSEAETK